jgi:hypothetical protein
MTTFNNHESVRNQAINQTFSGPVYFGGDASKKIVLASLAFSGMLDRRSAIHALTRTRVNGSSG